MEPVGVLRRRFETAGGIARFCYVVFGGSADHQVAAMCGFGPVDRILDECPPDPEATIVLRDEKMVDVHTARTVLQLHQRAKCAIAYQVGLLHSHADPHPWVCAEDIPLQVIKLQRGCIAVMCGEICNHRAKSLQVGPLRGADVEGVHGSLSFVCATQSLFQMPLCNGGLGWDGE